MFEKLEAVEKRYEELTKIISDPEVIANQSEWQKAMKEHAGIEDIVIKFREYKKVKQAMEEAEELMQDADMKELAEEEYYSSKDKLPKIEEELKILYVKLEQGLGEKKQHYLQEHYLECILCMQKRNTGN